MAKMTKKRCGVLVEKMAERYLGNPTGRICYHVSEASRTVTLGVETPIKHGCPLGRGYTESEAISDFCFRANMNDSVLKLRTEELFVAESRDYTTK